MSEVFDSTMNERASEGSNRREFLKTAGAAAASMATLSATRGASGARSSRYCVAPSRVIGANDRIGIGHIGVGGQGTAHLHSMHDSATELNHQSIAVCDLWTKRLEGAQQFIGASADKAYRRYPDLLSDKDIDVVVIATPEHWHARMAMDAIKAGKDVYLEKPMTRRWEEAIELYHLVKASDRILQVGSQGCSDTKWHVAGDVVKSGKIGKKIWSQSAYCRNNPSGEWQYDIDPSANPSNLDWNEWLGIAPKIPWNPDRYFRWRKYWDYSSGIINDLFPHRLNPLMIALNSTEWPLRVSCSGWNTDPNREVAETTHMLVDYPSNHTIVVAGSTVNETGLEDIIRGNEATLYFGGSGVEIRPEPPYSDKIDHATVPVVGPGESIAEHEKNFFNSVRTRTAPNCPVDLAAPVQVALAMAEIAYKTNQQVHFDSEKMKVLPGPPARY